MKMYLGSEPQYDRFCKSCNLMYKSQWDKVHNSNWKALSYEERKKIEKDLVKRHGYLPVFSVPSGKHLSSFEESARPYKYQIVFAKQHQMDFKLAMSPIRIEKWLKTPTKKIYADVPPLTEPAIKVPREFHEEFERYKKKFKKDLDRPERI
jgi:hypothetical protein